MSISANIIFSGTITLLVGAAYAWRRSNPPPPPGHPWDETRWSEITQKVRFFEGKMNFETPVELREDDEVFAQHNTNVFAGKSYICLSPKYVSMFPDVEQNFIIAHELGHKKHQTLLKITTLMEFVAIVIPSIVIPILFPGILLNVPLYFITSLVFGWLSLCTTDCVFSRWRERLADYEAYLTCGKKGGIDFLSRPFLYEENGIFNFLCCDAKHPSMQNRISNLERWDKEQPGKAELRQ